MRSILWTAERVDLLQKLWAKGETATAIAARLGGMSRSAVLGKIFRLRLGAADVAAGSQRHKSVGAAAPGAGRSPAHATPASARSFLPARRRRGGKQNKPDRCTPAAASPYKTLLELTNDSCRWPHGRPGTKKFFFCGAAGADLEHGIPYCARHMRRAYLAPEDIVAEEKPAAPPGLHSPFARRRNAGAP